MTHFTKPSGQQPLVTVVISCYNHANYIESCIDSVLNQTYPTIQLLTYDDGSSDESPKILQRLSQQNKFSFTLQTNRGLSATLNDAVKRASGKYFCAIGSDDLLFLDKTAKQVAYLESHPEIAVCGGNAIFIDDKGTIINKRQRFHPERNLDFDDLFENRQPGFVSPTAMIRTDVLRESGGYRNDIPLEDLYLWLKLATKGYGIHVLNDLLLYYRKHESNTYKNIAFMRDSIQRTLQDYSSHPSYKQVMGDEMNSLFLAAIKQGEKKLAFDILKDLSFDQYSKKTLRGLVRMLAP